MGTLLEQIDSELTAWISQQRLFFVATAPLAASGHVNISPKGGDAFRVIGPLEVAYQDYTGSGAETIAHVRENGRIAIMFCAFEGPPRILRLHGHGTVVTARHPRFAELSSAFPEHAGTRAFIHVSIRRVSSSCGQGVPSFDFRESRDALDQWTARQDVETLREYRAKKNQRSIDGLPALSESIGEDSSI